MTSDAKTVDEYLASLNDTRHKIILNLLNAVRDGITAGFEECMNYGMIGFVVPLSSYPMGYLGKNDVPLPFVNIASQKNHIALYHCALYSDKSIMNWFTTAYTSIANDKLNMGKSCIRWKENQDIPLSLITELMTKISMQQWIDMYEKNRGFK